MEVRGVYGPNDRPEEIDAVDLGQALAAAHGVERWGVVVHVASGSLRVTVESTALRQPPDTLAPVTELIELDAAGHAFSRIVKDS